MRPVRHVVAASLEGGYCSPAMSAMRDILVEVGEEMAAPRPELTLVG